MRVRKACLTRNSGILRFLAEWKNGVGRYLAGWSSIAKGSINTTQGEHLPRCLNRTRLVIFGRQGLRVNGSSQICSWNHQPKSSHQEHTNQTVHQMLFRQHCRSSLDLARVLVYAKQRLLHPDFLLGAFRVVQARSVGGYKNARFVRSQLLHPQPKNSKATYKRHQLHGLKVRRRLQRAFTFGVTRAFQYQVFRPCSSRLEHLKVRL